MLMCGLVIILEGIFSILPVPRIDRGTLLQVLRNKRVIQKSVPKVLLQMALQILDLPASKTPGIFENNLTLNLAKGLNSCIVQR